MNASFEIPQGGVKRKKLSIKEIIKKAVKIVFIILIILIAALLICKALFAEQIKAWLTSMITTYSCSPKQAI